MVFTAGGSYLGHCAAATMQLLIVTSFLVCLIAFHNACARYLFSMSSGGLLPNSLARNNPKT